MALNSRRERSTQVEQEGEGNYASTVFSDFTTSQGTDQGLTLSPKIQLDDPWFFNVDSSFEEQDLDTLLGTVNFDLIVEEAQTSRWGNRPNHDHGQDYERPAKRRKAIKEPLENAPRSFDLDGPASKHETPSPFPHSVLQASSFLNKGIAESKQNLAISGEADVMHFSSSSHLTSRSMPPENQPPPKRTTTGPLAAQNLPLGTDNESYYSPPTPLVASPFSAEHRLNATTTDTQLLPAGSQVSPHSDLQIGHEVIEDPCNEETKVQSLDSVDDDGSLFGDDVSNHVVSVNCYKTGELSCRELDAELETQLEADLAAELDAESGMSTRLTVPTVCLESSLSTMSNPTAPMPDQGLHSSAATNTTTVFFGANSHLYPDSRVPLVYRQAPAPQLAVDNLNIPSRANVAPPSDSPAQTTMLTKEWTIPPRPKPGRRPATDIPCHRILDHSRASAPAVLVETERRTSNRKKPRQAPAIFVRAGLPASDYNPVYWDPNTPICSVENNIPDCQSSQGGKKRSHRSNAMNKTSAEVLSLKARLVDLELRLAQVSPQSFLQAGPAMTPSTVSEEAQSEVKSSSTSQHSQSPIPYLLALSLASGESKEAIERSYQDLRISQSLLSDQKEPQSSAQTEALSSHQVPPQLRTLLDSLHMKFHNDQQFRKSALLWALEKASLQQTQCCDYASELTQLKEELYRVTSERDAYKALANDLKGL